MLLITFASTLLLDLERAVFIGVLLSLTLFIYKAAHPRVRRLRATDPLMRYAPDNMPEGLVVYVIEGTLFFGAIHELERQLYEEDDTPPRLVVLHLTRVFWLDASGAHALEQFLERCYARSVPVVLVVGSRNVRDILGRTGVIDCLSDGFVADTLGDGLRIGVDTTSKSARMPLCSMEPWSPQTGMKRIEGKPPLSSMYYHPKYSRTRTPCACPKD